MASDHSDFRVDPEEAIDVDDFQLAIEREVFRLTHKFLRVKRTEMIRLFLQLNDMGRGPSDAHEQLLLDAARTVREQRRRRD